MFNKTLIVPVCLVFSVGERVTTLDMSYFIFYRLVHFELTNHYCDKNSEFDESISKELLQARSPVEHQHLDDYQRQSKDQRSRVAPDKKKKMAPATTEGGGGRGIYVYLGTSIYCHVHIWQFTYDALLRRYYGNASTNLLYTNILTIQYPLLEGHITLYTWCGYRGRKSTAKSYLNDAFVYIQDKP